MLPLNPPHSVKINISITRHLLCQYYVKFARLLYYQNVFKCSQIFNSIPGLYYTFHNFHSFSTIIINHSVKVLNSLIKYFSPVTCIGQ